MHFLTSRSPPTADLPRFRVAGNQAFENVACDLCGPLYCRTENNGTSKIYIVVFTCPTSRAIHLEIAQSLSAESFLQALRRYVSRRGIPATILTDNAQYFKRTDKILKKLFSSKEVTNYLLQKRIIWKYNLASTPWAGGLFERMVQTVKRALRKTLKNARLTQEEIHTIITEIEATINSRPLCYVYSEEVDNVLTPSHLIIGKRILNIPDPDSLEKAAVIYEGDTPSVITKPMKFLARILRQYWTQWKHHYLTELREYHRLKAKREGTSFVAENDIVIVRDDNLPRNSWRMGRVEDLVKAKDGQIRRHE